MTEAARLGATFGNSLKTAQSYHTLDQIFSAPGMNRRRQDQFGASCKFVVIISLSSSTAFETLHIDRILMIITYTPLKIAKGTYRHGRNEVRASAKLSLP